ncbi:MAG: peptidylprolyl isomerase [Candidatus Auribacterota bacterium]|jgi:parvulin-like peptidyl-prolyl isomerase|nr:peptidylprolyl isomerase [Candidatus Auribacterota bacterium]
MKKTYLIGIFVAIIAVAPALHKQSIFVTNAFSEEYTRTVKFPVGSVQTKNFAQAEVAPELIVARVNGVPILGSDLNRAINSLKNMIMESGQIATLELLPESYLQKEAVDTLIANELLFQESQKMNLNISDEDLDKQIELIKEQTPQDVYQRRVASTDESVFRNSVKKTLLIHHVVESKMNLSKDDVDEELVQKYYDELKKTMKRTSVSLRMSHICVMVDPSGDAEEIENKRQKIQQAKNKLDEGADWNEVVAEFSEDPEKQNDGDIGYYSMAIFQNDILEGTVPEKIDEVSDIIRSKRGFHIVKITDRKPKGGYLTYEEALPALKSIAFREQYQGKIMEIVAQLKKDAKVDIYLDVKNDWKN